MSKAKKPATTMDEAMKLFRAAFKKPMKNKTARQTAIYWFESRLGMASTTAATYFSHCMKKVREADHAKVVAEASKTPWTAVKVDGKGAVTSYGMFLSQAAAIEFNKQYEHDGVVHGAVEQGQILDVTKLKTA